jgi:hypothetical protein
VVDCGAVGREPLIFAVLQNVYPASANDNPTQ